MDLYRQECDAGGEKHDREREARLKKRPVNAEDRGRKNRIAKRTYQRQSSRAIEFAEGRLKGPLEIGPGLSRSGEAQRIVARNPARLQDEFRRAQMPPHTGILENATGIMEHPKFDGQKEKKTESRQPPDRFHRGFKHRKRR